MSYVILGLSAPCVSAAGADTELCLLALNSDKKSLISIHSSRKREFL